MKTIYSIIRFDGGKMYVFRGPKVQSAKHFMSHLHRMVGAIQLST